MLDDSKMADLEQWQKRKGQELVRRGSSIGLGSQGDGKGEKSQH